MRGLGSRKSWSASLDKLGFQIPTWEGTELIPVITCISLDGIFPIVPLGCMCLPAAFDSHLLEACTVGMDVHGIACPAKPLV